MNKTELPIKGMHCRSCEILIGDKLKELPNIKNVQVSYKNSQVTIYSKKELNSSEIDKVHLAVKEAGYEVGVDESKFWISQNPDEYVQLAKSFALLLVLYFIAKKFGLFNINAGSTNNPSNLLVVLFIGLTAGISTCMALVGGLILGISARHSEKHPTATPFQKFRPHIYFNLGRIGSYFILGGLIGLIGKAFQLSGPLLGVLTIGVGVVMLILGAQLTDMFPKLSNGGLTLPPSVSRFFGIKKHQDKEYSHGNSVLIGALTFFLPCGFTQAMQLYAMSTGSFWSGALIMSAFALGTAPGLLSIGGLTSVLKGAFAKKFFKFTGLLVIFLAIFNISNGYRLTGWSNIFASDNNVSQVSGNDPNVVLQNSVQIVRMNQTATGYSPNKFTIVKGIPVKWIINSEDSNSCSASILMPKLKIRQYFKSGENIIEFTPTETGELKFTCGMGMYPGKFIVVEPTTPEAVSASPSVKLTNNPSASSSITPSSTPSISPQALQSIPQESPSSNANSDVQVITTTFGDASRGSGSDITPNQFTLTAGKQVRFEINATADGAGCMSTIMIPGIINEPELLQKGQTIKWEFTPKKGTYNITCAMGIPRGKIVVN